MDPTRINLSTDPVTRRMTGYTAHGNHYFDVPFMTEIRPGLWQGGCEDGLILPRQIKHLISLYPWESYKINHEVDTKLEVRALDSATEAIPGLEAIVDWAWHCWQEGETLIHCQAGLNRSSVVICKLLIRDGMSGDDAIALVRGLRSQACLCNPAFEKLIRES